MIRQGIVFFIILITQSALLFSLPAAVLVHNTEQDIDACRGKLNLNLIRIWGGAEEQDEYKFFSYPKSLALDKKSLVYICDQTNHSINVFRFTGKFLRTIGTRGRGPGDLLGPGSIDFSPSGDLWVGEMGGRRVQCFTSTGKSKTIFKHNGFIWWLGVTSKNEIAIYCHQKTFDTKTLLSIYSDKGKLKREIGVYHDKSKVRLGSETLVFSKDGDDDFYVGNKWAPVIRKYSPEGGMIKAITFAPAFTIPVSISLNKNGNEIEKHGERGPEQFQVKKNSNGVTIKPRNTKRSKNFKTNGVVALGIGGKKNIYVVNAKRGYTEKERNSIRLSGNFSNFSKIDRSGVDFDVVEKIDIYRLLVFNPDGKIIAVAQLETFCDELYVYNDRIFILDGLLNQRVLEYKMTFKK